MTTMQRTSNQQHPVFTDPFEQDRAATDWSIGATAEGPHISLGHLFDANNTGIERIEPYDSPIYHPVRAAASSIEDDADDEHEEREDEEPSSSPSSPRRPTLKRKGSSIIELLQSVTNKLLRRGSFVPNTQPQQAPPQSQPQTRPPTPPLASLISFSTDGLLAYSCQHIPLTEAGDLAYDGKLRFYQSNAFFAHRIVDGESSSWFKTGAYLSWEEVPVRPSARSQHPVLITTSSGYGNGRPGVYYNGTPWSGLRDFSPRYVSKRGRAPRRKSIVQTLSRRFSGWGNDGEKTRGKRPLQDCI